MSRDLRGTLHNIQFTKSVQLTYLFVRGIGAGIAIQLARQGARVVVNYTSPRGATAAESVIKEIDQVGSKATLVQADVSKISDLQKLVDAAVALSESGKIDLLIHNAGNGDDRYLADMTEDFYEFQSDINLKGTVTSGMSFRCFLASSSFLIT